MDLILLWNLELQQKFPRWSVAMFPIAETFCSTQNIDFSSLVIHRENIHLKDQNNLVWSIFWFNQIWSKILWILITLHLNDNEILTIRSDCNSWALTELLEITERRYSSFSSITRQCTWYDADDLSFIRVHRWEKWVSPVAV